MIFEVILESTMYGVSNKVFCKITWIVTGSVNSQTLVVHMNLKCSKHNILVALQRGGKTTIFSADNRTVEFFNSEISGLIPIIVGDCEELSDCNCFSGSFVNHALMLCVLCPVSGSSLWTSQLDTKLEEVEVKLGRNVLKENIKGNVILAILQ